MVATCTLRPQAWRRSARFAAPLRLIADRRASVAALSHKDRISKGGRTTQQLCLVILCGAALVLATCVGDPGADSYAGQVIASRFGVLSTGPALGTRTLDVTMELIHDLEAPRLYSQYRLRFWKALPGLHDDAYDHVQFGYAEVPDADEVPRLVVEYR